MDYFGVGLTFKLCLISIITVNCNPAAVKESYESLAQGLYDVNDNVTVLNVTNFKSSVYKDTKGWLVEFYNSWCGYCFRFAPLWKSFASDVYGNCFVYFRVQNSFLYSYQIYLFLLLIFINI